MNRPCLYKGKRRRTDGKQNSFFKIFLVVRENRTAGKMNHSVSIAFNTAYRSMSHLKRCCLLYRAHIWHPYILQRKSCRVMSDWFQVQTKIQHFFPSRRINTLSIILEWNVECVENVFLHFRSRNLKFPYNNCHYSS
jgi:hypothetical protein